MQLAILIKDAFLEAFYYDTPLGFVSLWTPMCTSCTSCPLVWRAKKNVKFRFDLVLQLMESTPWLCVKKEFV